MGTRGALRQCGDGLSPPLRLVIGFSQGSASHDAALAAAPHIAAALGRPVDVSFQSRFGRAKWLEPSTETTLKAHQANKHEKSTFEACFPSFVASPKK